MIFSGDNFITWLIILTAIVYFAVLFLELRRSPRMMLIPLFAIRALAFVLLFILFSQSGGMLYDRKPLKNQLVVLKDVSGSMAMLPGKLKEKVADFETLLKDKYGKETITYDFAAESFRGDSKQKPLPNATAIGNALLTVNSKYPGCQLVLLTDGAENLGLSALSAAGRLNNYATRVYPVNCGVADDGDNFDFALSGVFAPGEWTAGIPVFLRGTVERSGKAPDNCSLTVYIDGRKAVTQNIDLGRQNYRNFELKMPDSFKIEPGWHQYLLEITKANGEINGLNNKAEGVFLLRSRSKVRLLWSNVNPDFSYLKPLLLDRYGRQFEIIFSSDLKRMSEVDQLKMIRESALLILEKIKPDDLKPEALNELKSSLEKRETSLIFLNPSCLNDWSTDEAFKDLLPIMEGAYKRFSSRIPWQLKFKFQGRIWDLPVYSGYRLPAKSLSYVKLFATKGDEPVPVIISSGRVTCLVLSSAWRWRLNPSSEVRKGLKPFWKYFFSNYDYLGSGKLELKVRQDHGLLNITEGEKFTFELNDWSVGKRDNDNFKLVLEDSKGINLKNVGKFKHESEGLYLMDYEVSEPGIHWFRAVKIGEKAGQKQVASNRVPLMIEASSAELAASGDNSGFLKKLAELTGGKMLSLNDQTAQLDKKFTQKDYYLSVKKSNSSNLFMELIIAGLLIILLSAEWFMRHIEKEQG
jgi:hypothetical protein